MFLLINPLKLGKSPLRHAVSAMDGAAASTTPVVAPSIDELADELIRCS
jgi:hypothetical protein